eukprot:751454-Hanusia_phi.AAC.2
MPIAEQALIEVLSRVLSQLTGPVSEPEAKTVRTRYGPIMYCSGANLNYRSRCSSHVPPESIAASWRSISQASRRVLTVPKYGNSHGTVGSTYNLRLVTGLLRPSQPGRLREATD